MDREFYKARITVLEMLQDRNYTRDASGTNDFNILLVDFDEFKKMFAEANSDASVLDLSGITDRDGMPVIVRFITQEKEKNFFSQLEKKYDKSVFK